MLPPSQPPHSNDVDLVDGKWDGDASGPGRPSKRGKEKLPSWKAWRSSIEKHFGETCALAFFFLMLAVGFVVWGAFGFWSYRWIKSVVGIPFLNEAIAALLMMLFPMLIDICLGIVGMALAVICYAISIPFILVTWFWGLFRRRCRGPRQGR